MDSYKHSSPVLHFSMLMDQYFYVLKLGELSILSGVVLANKFFPHYDNLLFTM